MINIKNLKILTFLVLSLVLINQGRAKTSYEKTSKQLTEKSKIKVHKAGKLIPDIKYGPSPEQMIDVYLPKGKPQPQIFFMVNGDSWKIVDRKSKKFIENKIVHWVSKGFILVSVGYRKLPEANPLTQANDVVEALNFTQEKAPEWGADPNQVIMLGYSTGAHLVSLIGASANNSKSLEANKENLVNVEIEKLKTPLKPILATIALDSAAMNIPVLMLQNHSEYYDEAMGVDPKFWEKISPYQQLKSKTAPFYLVCSIKQMDACVQNEEFAKKLKSLRSKVQISKVNLSHSELGEQLNPMSKYTIDLDKFLRQLGLKL